MKIFKTLLKAGIIGAGAGVAASARFAHNLAFPKKYSLEQVKKYEVSHGTFGNYDEVRHTNYTVTGKDGVVLHCEYAEANPGSKKIVILTHGYTSNRNGMVKYAVVYMKLGFNCVLYDTRGHGANERHFACSIGNLEAQDLLHVIDDTYERYGDDIEIGLQGESMGSSTSLSVLKYHPKVRFVVADCGFTNLYDLIGVLYKEKNLAFMRDPVNLIMKPMYGFNMKETSARDALHGNKVPICLIHGTADSFIKQYNSDELAAATDGYNEVHKVDGAEHALCRMVLGEEGYLKIVKGFLDNIEKEDSGEAPEHEA